MVDKKYIGLLFNPLKKFFPPFKGIFKCIMVSVLHQGFLVNIKRKNFECTRTKSACKVILKNIETQKSTRIMGHGFCNKVLKFKNHHNKIKKGGFVSSSNFGEMRFGGFCTVAGNQESCLKRFIQYLIFRGYGFEKNLETLPVYKQDPSQFLEPNVIFKMIHSKKITMTFSTKGSIKRSSLIIVNFNLQKLPYINDRFIMHNLRYRIELLAKELDFTLVSTPDGGYQAFFEAKGTPFETKTSQSRVLVCFLTNVDFFGGKSKVTAPNGLDGKILNLSSSFKNFKEHAGNLPKVFYPITSSLLLDKEILSKSRGSCGYPLREGYRSYNCLHL